MERNPYLTPIQYGPEAAEGEDNHRDGHHGHGDAEQDQDGRVQPLIPCVFHHQVSNTRELKLYS